MEKIQILEQKVNYQGLINSIDIKPDEYLLALNEVIINSIQSIEDSKNPKGDIIVRVHTPNQERLSLEDGEEHEPITGFTVVDNGVGFTNSREEAFSTPYTSFNVKKGGKGMGRYTVLACFGSMEVESSFAQQEQVFHRSYRFDKVGGLQKYPEKTTPKGKALGNKTIVKLNNYEKPFFHYMNDQKLKLEDIAEGIIQHSLLYFLNYETTPTIRLLYDYQKIEDALVLNDIYRAYIEVEKIEPVLRIEGVQDTFKLSYIRNYNGVQTHSVHLCANKRQVGNKHTLTQYLPSFKELHDGAKKYHLSVYVESKFLDAKNHPQRNRFMLSETNSKKGEFDDISLEELFHGISDNVRTHYSEQIETAEKEKNERIQNYILNPRKPRLRYRHLINVPNAFKDIPINCSDEVLEARLHEKEFKLEQKRNRAFQKVFKKKKYDREEFGKIVSEILQEETAFSKDKLADLMIKRKSVLKLFRKYLEWRNDGENLLEEDLHNIIFTMGADSDEIPADYHNLWLLDERLTFHSYTTSDKQLRTNKALDSKSQKEPDLFIYDIPWAYSDNPNKINSLVLFEFKRPGRDMNTTQDKKLDSQVNTYFEKLSKSKAKNSKGRFLQIKDETPKFGYVICDLHPDLIEYNVKWNGFKQSPNGTLYKINSEQNLFIEVTDYTEVVDSAEKRHEVFFKALGVENL